MQRQEQPFPVYTGPHFQQGQNYANNNLQTSYRSSEQFVQMPTQYTAPVESRKIYACSEPGCTEYFDQSNNLRAHQRVAHGNNRNEEGSSRQQNRPYICPFPECGKSFTQYGNLKTHSRKHTGERPYHCTYDGCDKAFTQLGNLKTHEKIHWAVKPFTCVVPGCGKGFTQRGNLKTHQTKVHQITPP